MKFKLFFIFYIFFLINVHSQVDVIEDGSFTAGISFTEWTSTPDFYYNTQFDNGNGDDGYAYLSTPNNVAGNNLSGTIIQEFSNNVPSNGVSSGNLNFYVSITTTETTTSNIYDYVEARITANNNTYNILQVSNLDFITGNGSYKNFNVTLQQDVINAINDDTTNNITLWFYGETDNASVSVIRIDDVELFLSEDNSGGGNGFNIAVENVSVSDTSPDIGQTITLDCDHVVLGDCGCTDNFDPNPDVGFGWSYDSTFNAGSFNLIDTQSSSIGSDSGDGEDINWIVPDDLEGQTVYVYFIPDYFNEHSENLEGDYMTVGVNVNDSNQNTDGNITLNLLPSEAISDGAQWKTTNTATWLNSGETLTLPFGTYTIEFKDIPGWNEPANQAITISDSSPNYANQFTYSEENTNSGTISGNLINLEMNDNFQMVNGSLNGFVIKLFENGNGTPIQQTNANNGSFVFNNLSDGLYHIEAQSIFNGTVEFQTKKSVSIANSNTISVTLKSSKGLISQIENINNELSNLSCYWNYTGQNYNVNTNSTNNSYDVNVTTSYIQNNAFIIENDEEVLDKLSRFAILSKATLEYYELGCELTSEYLESFKDGTSASFDLLEGLICAPSNFNNPIISYLFNAIRNTTIYIIEDGEYANELSIVSSLNMIFDNMELYLGGFLPSISSYAQLITVNGVDEQLVNSFLVNGYINKTASQFYSSIDEIFNNNLNSDISDLGNDTKNALFLVENSSVNVVIASASAYRNTPAWIDFIDLVNNTFGSGCNPLSVTWNVNSNLTEIASVTNSIFQLNFGRKELYNMVNMNLFDITFENSSFDSNCTNDYISVLINNHNIKINQYNTELNIISNNIDNIDPQSITNILNIQNELNYIEEILRSMFLKIQSNSNLDISSYINNYQNSSYTGPVNRTAMNVIIFKYYETSNIDLKNQILNHKNQTINSNNSGHSSWINLYNSLNSFCSPVDLILTKRDVPRLIGTNSNLTIELEVTNTGSFPANNVNIQVISNGSINLGQNNFFFATINPTSSYNISVPVSSGSIIDTSKLQIVITSDEMNMPFKSTGIIATVDPSSLRIQESNYIQDLFMYPNPVYNELNISGLNLLPIKKTEIYNSQGKLVLKTNTNSRQLDVSNLQNGLYIIKIYTEKDVSSLKFIKR